MLLYDYGPISWIWRGFIVFLMALAAVFLIAGFSPWNPLMVVGAAALLAPVVFFGTALVVRADRLDGGGLEIQTLLFVRRRLASGRLGTPRVRVKYRSEHGDFAARRVTAVLRSARADPRAPGLSRGDQPAGINTARG
jgi:hypothetical protein